MADSDSNPFGFLSDLGDSLGSALGGLGDTLGSLASGAGNGIASLLGAGPDAAASAAPAQPQAGAVNPANGAPGSPDAAAQYAMPSYQDAYGAAKSTQGIFGKLLGLGPLPENVQGNLTSMTNKALTEHEAAAVQLLGQMSKNSPNASPSQLLLDATQTPEGMALFEKGGLTPAAIKEVMTQFQNKPEMIPYGNAAVTTTGTGDATKSSVGSGTGLSLPQQAELGRTAEIIDPQTAAGQARFKALGKTVDPGAGPQTVETTSIPGFGERVLKMTPLSAIANPAQQSHQKLIDRTDKSNTELIAKQSSLVSLNRAGDTVTKLLANANTPTGLASELARGGYGIKTQVGDLINMYNTLGQAAPNMEPTNKAYNGAFDRFNDALKVNGTNAARLDSALLNIGYVIARGNKGSDSRVTESDVKNALDQIGDNGLLTNGTEISAAITQTIQQANQNADDEWQVKTADGQWDPGTVKPEQPTIYLHRMGHNTFLPQASDATGQGPNGPNFDLMTRQALKAFPNTPAAKGLSPEQMSAYIAATKKPRGTK